MYTKYIFTYYYMTRAIEIFVKLSFFSTHF